MISLPYLNAKRSLCDAVMPAMIELMAISIIIGFFNLFNSIFGVCFVIRNKIDVPIYKPVRTNSTNSKSKKKGKKEKNSMK